MDNDDENGDEVLVTALTKSSIIVEDEENVLEKVSDDEKVNGLSQVQSGDVGKGKRPWCKSNRKRAKMSEVDNAILRSAESLYWLSNEFDNKQRIRVEDEDADSLFCRSLSTRLRRLPGNIKAYVRVQVEQLFYQAETSTFQPSSGVQHTSPSIIQANTASEQGQSMQPQYFVLN